MLSSTFSRSLLSALAVVSGLSLINQSVVGETTLYNTPYGNAYGSPIVAFIAPEPYLRFNDGKRIEYGVADYLSPAVVSIEGAGSGSGSGYGPSSAGTGTHSGTGWNSYHHGVDTEHISSPLPSSSGGSSFYGVPAVLAVAPPAARSSDDSLSIVATDSKLKSAALPFMDTVILDNSRVTEKLLVAEESNVTVVDLGDKKVEFTSGATGATEMPALASEGEGAKIVEVKTGETDFELPTATDTSDDSVVISLPEKENNGTTGGYGYGNGNSDGNGNGDGNSDGNGNGNGNGNGDGNGDGNEVGSGTGSGYGYGPSAAVLLSSKSNDIGNDKENVTFVEYGTPTAPNMAMPNTVMPTDTTTPRPNFPNISYGQPSGGYSGPVGPYVYLQQPQPQTVNLIPLETTNQILETVNDGQSEMTKIAIEIQIDNNTAQII